MKTIKLHAVPTFIEENEEDGAYVKAVDSDHSILLFCGNDEGMYSSELKKLEAKQLADWIYQWLEEKQ